MSGRICNGCREVKPISDFYTRPNGFVSKRCRACAAAASLEWRAKNPGRAAAARRRYVEKNPEKCAEAASASQKAKPEVYAAASRRYYNKNPEKVKALMRKQMEELHDCYIARSMGISVKDATPELLELKREQLRVHRMARELKKSLKENKE